jgi:hypothetical protein
MHGPSFNGDAKGALRALGDDYDRRLQQAMGTSGTQKRRSA